MVHGYSQPLCSERLRQEKDSANSLLQQLGQQGWQSLIRGLPKPSGPRPSLLGNSGFSLHSESLADAFAPFAVDRFEEVLKKLKTDIATLVLRSMDDRFSKQLLLYMNLIASIHESLSAGFRSADDKKIQKQADEDCRMEGSPSNVDIGESHALGMKYAISVLLVLIESIHKNEPVVLKDALLMISELLRGTDAKSLIHDLQSSCGSKWLEPLFNFFLQILRTDGSHEDLLEKQLSIFIMVKFSILSGSIRWILCSLESLLLLAEKTSFVLDQDLFNVFPDLYLAMNCDPPDSFSHCVLNHSLKNSPGDGNGARSCSSTVSFPKQTSLAASSSELFAYNLLKELQNCIKMRCPVDRLPDSTQHKSSSVPAHLDKITEDCSPESFSSFVSFIIFVRERLDRSDDFLHGRILWCLLSLLKTHFQQIRSTGLSFSFPNAHALLSELEALVFQKTDHNCLHVEISTEVQKEASQLLISGLEIFFPRVSDQVNYILRTLELYRDQRSETSLRTESFLQLLYNRLSCFDYVQTIMLDVEGSDEVINGYTLLCTISQTYLKRFELVLDQSACGMEIAISTFVESKALNVLQPCFLSRILCGLETFPKCFHSTKSSSILCQLVEYLKLWIEGSNRMIKKAFSLPTSVLIAVDEFCGDHLFLKIVHPLLVFALTLPIAVRGSILFYVSDSLSEFLGSVASLRSGVIANKSLPSFITKTHILESAHPYAVNSSSTQLLDIGTCDSVEIQFDPRSQTADAEDVVEVYTGNNTKKLKIGHFCENQWHGPMHRVKVSSPHLMVSLISKSSKMACWGYLVKIVSFSYRPPYSWLFEIARCAATLCGNLAAAAIDGFRVTDEETLNRRWLSSGLFNGSFETCEPSSQCFDDFILDAPVSIPVNPNGLRISDQEEFEFIKQIELNINCGANLITKLRSFASFPFPIPKSIKPLTELATRVVFAVFLKHCMRVEQAMGFALEPPHVRPDDNILRLWRKANEIESSFATRFGQGYDKNLLVEQILKKAHFLLSISVSKPTVPLLSLTRQSSGSMSHIFPALFRGNSSSKNAMRRTLKAMRLIKDECQPASQEKPDNSSCFAIKDSDSHMCKQILLFFEDQSVNVDSLKRAIVHQKSRAILRFLSVERFCIFYSATNCCDLRRDMLYFFGQSGSRRHDLISKHHDVTDVGSHLLSDVECAGKFLQEKLLSTYYSLISMLIHSSCDDAQVLLIMNLMNFEIRQVDFEYLHRIGAIQFLKPMLLHSNLWKWKIRFAAWSLFRLLAYSCARIQAQEQEGSSESVDLFQLEVLELIFGQLHSFQRIRILAASTSQDRLTSQSLVGYEDGWSCKSCNFFNDSASDTCCSCASLSDTSGKQIFLWPCHRCTFLNKSFLEVCAICDAKRKPNTIPLEYCPAPSQKVKSASNQNLNHRRAPVINASIDDSFSYFFRRNPLVKLDGYDIMEPTKASFGKESALIVSETEIKNHFFIHTESDFSSLKIGIIFEDPPDSSFQDLSSSILYDASSGIISQGSKILASGECYGRGDVISVQILKTSVIFFKNSVIQGHRIHDISLPFRAAVFAQECTVSLVSRDSFIRRSSDWILRAQKMPLKSACIAWYSLEFADLGENGARHVALNENCIEEIDLLTNQLLWVLARCCSSISFQRIICNIDWIRSIISMATDCKYHWISRTLSLRICRSIFPLTSPNSDFFSGIGSDKMNIISYFMGAVGQSSISLAGDSIPNSLWIASEIVAFVRFLWLDDTWCSIVSHYIKKAIQSLPSCFLEIKSKFSTSNGNDIQTGKPFRRLSVCIGALYILSAWVEPFREGGRVFFVYDGHCQEGVISLYRPEPLRMVIDGKGPAFNSFEISSRDGLDIHCIQPISELDLLPETLSNVSIVINNLIELLPMAIDEDTPTVQLLQSQIIRMTARVLQHILKHDKDSKLFEQSSDLTPILSLALTPTNHKFSNDTPKLESRYLWLSDQYQPALNSTKTDNRSKRQTVSRSELPGSTFTNRVIGVPGGQIIAFGKGDNGRLGLGNDAATCVPTLVPGFGPVHNSVVAVSCFSSHIIALTNLGVPYSWGKGDDGRLGHGGTKPENAPRQIKAMEGIRCVQACAGLNFSFLLDENGSIWGFGSNANGQIGIGAFPSQMTPIRVKGDLEDKVVAKVCAGGSHVLAITNNGNLYSWGKNVFGQLGQGTTQKLSTPKLVKAAKSISFVLIAGGWEHSMAVTSDGILYTWGAGYEGNRPVCGHGSNEKELLPRQVEGLSGKVVVHIAAGWDHSLAITNDGKLFSWGHGNCGMLGHGSVAPASIPTLVEGPLKTEKCVWADGGQDHTIVITARGQAWVFGSGGAHAGTDISTAIHEPQLIKDTRPSLVFGSVSCGDKCTFLLSSQIPRTVPSKPVLQNSGLTPLPVYPLRLHFCGDQHNFFVERNRVRDLVNGRSASFECANSSTSTLTNTAAERLFSDKIVFDVDCAQLSMSSISLSVCTNLSDSTGTTFLTLSYGDDLFEISLKEDQLIVLSKHIMVKVIDIRLADAEWHNVLMTSNLESVSVFVDGNSVWTIPYNEFMAKGTLSKISVGPFKGSVRDVALWDVSLTNEQIFSVANSGMSFVLSDLQLDEMHRQNWQFGDFSTGPNSIIFEGNSGIRENPKAPFGQIAISVNGNFSFLQDNRGLYLHLDDNSCFSWRNIWNAEIDCFSIVLEILSDVHAKVSLLAMMENPAVSVEWTQEGRFQFSDAFTDICPAEKNCWNRVVITFDNRSLKQLAVFVNGVLVGTLNVTEPVCLHQGLLFFPSNEDSVSIRFVQIFRSCLSLKEVLDIGNPADPLVSSALLSSISGTLRQTGFPTSWIHRALLQCKFNRYDSCKWILSNETFLLQEDAQAKLNEDANCLSVLGVPLCICVDTLRTYNGNYILALHDLMDGNEVFSRNAVKQKAKLGPFNKGFPDINVADDESAILENPAYRILDSSAETWQPSTINRSFSTSDHSSSANDSVLNQAIIISEMLQLDSKLTISYCRQAVLGILQNVVDSHSISTSFSLDSFGGLDFLVKFLRMIAFTRLNDALDTLKKVVVRILEQEMISWFSSDQNTFPQVSKFVLHDCLVHFIGHSLKSNCTIESEHMAIDCPNIEIGLWYLDIFVRLHRQAIASSNCHRQEFILSYLLCRPLINVIFKMLTITRGQYRLQFVLVLTHLAKTSTKFDGNELRFLKKQLFRMHDRYKENRIFPSFFQALLELVLLIENRNASETSLVDAPLWFRQFSELHEILSTFLMETLCQRSPWPAIFLNCVIESMRQCRNFDDTEDLEATIQKNRFEFTPKSDLELVHCLDRMLASATFPSLLTQQIPHLMPTQAQLKAYECINHHPLTAIHVRCMILYQLNEVICSAISLVNLSRTDEESELSCILRKARGLIFPLTKTALWADVLNRTASDAHSIGMSRDLKVQVNRFSVAAWKERHKVDLKGTRTCFGQVFQQVHHVSPSLLRIKRDERAWKIVFQGEFSDDYGGPYRNCLDLICEELQSSFLPLFIPCPNMRSKIGILQDKFLPNPSAISPLYITMFEFIGKLMGVAIRSKNLLNLNLPSIVWKSLVTEPITDEDIIEVDAVAFRVITNIRRMESDDHINPENFEEILSMTFSVSGSDEQEVELIPDGSSIPVTWTNKDDFIAALRTFRKEEFSVQCKAIFRGLSSIVPYPMLSLFTWKELELQVCGHPRIDVELLKSMTQYEWCSPSDPHICAFWEVLSENFDDSQRSEFLKFVWGRSRLPVNASEFDCKFKISNMPRARQDPDLYLPISHTCFFSIELPRYSSKQILHRRLLYAITHCVSIDADSTTAAQSSARMMSTTQYLSDDDIDG